MTTHPLLAQSWRALGGDADATAAVDTVGPVDTLPATLPVTALATATVGAAALAGAELAAARNGGRPPGVTVDSAAVATAFTSERHLRVDGAATPSFAPLSGFWLATDGWVRTHGNYPYHRARLLRAMGIDPDADDATAAADLALAVAGARADTVVEAVTAAGGLAVTLREPDAWAAHPQGAAVAELPLLRVRRYDDAPARRLDPAPRDPLLPAAGLRVLDLTRVIAGPVGTRTLALLGADVLRVDPPGLPEITAQHLDTGVGKRSTLLDLTAAVDRGRFDALLDEADVLVTGYRPGALQALGLDTHTLAARRPGLVVARLSAWGAVGPWAGRRGFDSLVQVATGIASVEADEDGTPGKLPAQALDHGTGYLLAAAVLRAVDEQLRHGGTRQVELSLAQTAAWLLHDHRPGPPGSSNSEASNGKAATGGAPASEAAVDPTPYLTDAATAVGLVRHARSPIDIAGGPSGWQHPVTPWGSDPARWR